jgi:3-phosphoshikimate 1-carboxyvinyltransferase
MTVTRLGRPLSAPASLRGTIEVPSDKSIAHRALIFSALAEGESAITLREPGQDVLSTMAALEALKTNGRLGSGTADCGNSGTTMRLLAGALASIAGASVLTGDASLSRRPMERVAAPLRLMTADIDTTDGHAPLTIRGRRPLVALEHRLPVASAQVLGAICLAALAAEGTTTVFVPGPTRDHTERMLASMGARVRREGSLTTVVGPALLRPISLKVPGDFSSAAAWLVAATVHPNAAVTLKSVGLNPTRIALIDVLREMGADIEVTAMIDEGGEPVGDLLVRSARLSATSVTSTQVPALIDELPLLAVAMAAADGTSEVRGAAELRVKESDRIGTMAAALEAAGARVEELPDGWRISRGTPRDAVISTHGDHRIAMAMAVAAWTGIATSVELDDPACVAVSYPSFWRDAAALGATT